MSILDSLFCGAKAFVRGVVSVVREVVHTVLTEFDNSSVGRATTNLMKGVTDKHFSRAQDLVEEVQDIADKRARDGRLNEYDQERLREIEAKRETLRKEMEAAKAVKSASEMQASQDQVISTEFTSDEAAAAVGIMASKECPNCGGMMRIMQGAYNAKAEKQTFYWKCTVPHSLPCPTLKLDPEADSASVLRPPDADLDGPHTNRRVIWTREDVLAKTHSRLRQGLGDNDAEVICPKHLLPMKQMMMPRAGGRMLDSYHYVCLAVNPDGRACDHTVDIKSFPQVAATLKRRDGVGIITS